MTNDITVEDQRTAHLRQAWEGIQKAKPGLRIREAARELGSSEAELLATTIGVEAVRLQGPWPELVKRLPELGKVMSLTRNDGCILEHKGPFQKIDIMGEGARAMGTVIGPIESRIFFGSWHAVFAVKQVKEDRELVSIQVFDKAGEAITKIYAQEGTNEEAFEKLVNDFTSPDQRPEQETTPYPEETFTQPDREAFLQAWQGLKDTHDFYPMLRKFNVHRQDAVALAEGRFSWRVSPSVLEHLLQEAATQKLPIMIFAGNRGNIQIHQGKVKTIRMIERGPESWLNVLDPDFNMHLRMDHAHSVWKVVKPTSDGDVTSVEVFDAHRNLVAQFFGLRKPGIPELEGWKRLMNSLPTL